MDKFKQVQPVINADPVVVEPSRFKNFLSLLCKLGLLLAIVIVVAATALYGEYLYLRTANFDLKVPGNLGLVYSQIDSKMGFDWEMLNDHPQLESQILINKTKHAEELDGITEWYLRDKNTLLNNQNGVPKHDNTPQKLSDFRDKKAVVLVFGRLACSYCQNIYSFLEEYKMNYGDRLEVIALQSPKYDEEKDWSKIVAELDERSITFPVGLDLTKTTANKYNVEFAPTLYLIDKDGYIVYSKYGTGNMSQVEMAIKQLLEIK